MPIIQSVLHPAGIQADRIYTLWQIMLVVTTTVYVLVMGTLAVAIVRGRSGAGRDISSRTVTRNVAGAVLVSTVTLIGLLFASVMTGRAIGSMQPDGALGIQITGYRWWWQVEYLNPDPSLRVTTANEIHLPVGRTVAISLKSADVIHSLWIPNLHGKTDLVPGRLNAIWLRADNPGVYRGQCAEYCGRQHAHMALTVVAESSETFEQWLAAQRQPAPLPSGPQQQEGLAIVQSGPCAMCHTIRGTTAGARLGPDLTHFASRSTIGAGTVPNTPGHLAGWLADPQHLKPGNYMPATGLSGKELQAVRAYLETLK